MMLCVLDPGMETHSGQPSANLGDLIIQDAVNRELQALYPEAETIRLSTHQSLDRAQCRRIAACSPVFVGGTNLLSSNMSDPQRDNPRGTPSIYRQWKVSLLTTLQVREVTLFGVGWWQYQTPPGPLTRLLLKRILSKKALHSVRDAYTEKMLHGIGISNVINTGCPTMWPFADAVSRNIPTRKASQVLVMLTDYLQSPKEDKQFLELLTDKYQRVFLWPQGRKDAEYVATLNVSVTLLDHSFAAFRSFLDSQHDLDYIGTRLHGGVWCLLHDKRSLILEIDNRAAEIARDTGLPTCRRGDIGRIRRWIEGPTETRITLPVDNINRWKHQFSASGAKSVGAVFSKTAVSSQPA